MDLSFYIINCDKAYIKQALITLLQKYSKLLTSAKAADKAGLRT